MFENLIESKPKKTQSGKQMLLSLLLHGVLGAGAIWATTGAAETVREILADTTMFILEPPKDLGERVDGALRPVLVEGAGELGELRQQSDDEPAQREEVRREHGGELLLEDRSEHGAGIRPGRNHGRLAQHAFTRGTRLRPDEFEEEPFLAAEVRVQRLLGDAGCHRDRVHCHGVVAMGEELLLRRGQHGLALADRARAQIRITP